MISQKVDIGSDELASLIQHRLAPRTSDKCLIFANRDEMSVIHVQTRDRDDMVFILNLIRNTLLMWLDFPNFVNYKMHATENVR